MKRIFARVGFPILVATSSVRPALAQPPATVIAGPAGGRIVVGRTAAGTPLAALHASGRAFGSRFDGAPVIESIAESADGRAAYATFRSSYARVPVVGVIVAATSGGRTQLVAFADRPDRIRTSLGPMLAAFERKASRETRASSQAEAAAPAPLRPYAFPDGSGSVSLPADWSVKSAGQGQVTAAGPNGESALLGVGPLIVDPRAGMQAQVALQSGGLVLPYSSDPRTVYTELQAALARRANLPPGVSFTYAQPIPSDRFDVMAVEATETGKRGPETVMGVISVSPMMMGGYTFFMQLMIAPSDRLARERPTLLAIYHSYRVNGAVRAQQVRQSEAYDRAFANASSASIEATGQASLRAAREADAAMDRSTSGFVHYLNGTDVVENLTTGARGSVGEDWAQGLARDDPQEFRVVPMTEYRAGD